MDDNGIKIKETFALAVQNHQKNNLQVAENLYKETLVPPHGLEPRTY